MNLNPLYIAFQLMTRLPVPMVKQGSSRDYGYSVLFYPLVGLAIGGVLTIMAMGMNYLSLDDKPLLMATILLLLWVVITGALHLDGLADSADAWLGGFGDEQRTLDIMKDPNAGSAAVVALIMLLLFKVIAISYLLNETVYLLWIPVLARSTIIALFLTTPYVREQGIASRHAAALPRLLGWLVMLFSWLVSGLFIDDVFLILLLVMSFTWLGLRLLMVKRIGGMTGDTAGAMIEIIEAVLLFTAAVLT